jgi:hypothetical protein
LVCCPCATTVGSAPSVSTRSQSGVMAEYYRSANSVLAAQSATKFVERAG